MCNGCGVLLTGPAGWLYYALTGSSVVYLRYSQPHLRRPFRVPCYPLPPLLLVLLATVLLISSLLRSPLYCLLAMFFIAVSVPVWMVAERFQVDEELTKGLRLSLTSEGGGEGARPEGTEEMVTEPKGRYQYQDQHDDHDHAPSTSAPEDEENNAVVSPLLT